MKSCEKGGVFWQCCADHCSAARWTEPGRGTGSILAVEWSRVRGIAISVKGAFHTGVPCRAVERSGVRGEGGAGEFFALHWVGTS